MVKIEFRDSSDAESRLYDIDFHNDKDFVDWMIVHGWKYVIVSTEREE